MSSYKIYKKTISVNSSKFLFKHLLSICNFYKPNTFKSFKIYKNLWNDESFTKKMIGLRKNKKLFSSIYDTMQLSNELYSIAYKNNFNSIASKFLSVPASNLMLRSVQFRMDFPDDSRNSYGWHQDNAYDKYNLLSKNGVVLWIPLVDTNVNNGTLIIKPGSENSTFKCSKKVFSGNKYKSEQILVMKKYLKKYKSKSINVKKNNCLTTFCGLFHKSGVNTSNHIRFTIIARLNNMLSKDFLFYRRITKKKTK